MSFRILLTSAGGAMSPIGIRMMRNSTRHKIEVIAVDKNPDAVGRYFADVFATVPSGDAPGYVERVVEIAKAHGANLILPCSDEEALALARRREQVESTDCKLACADTATLEMMSSKLASLEFLAAAGLPVPQWHVARSAAEVLAAIEALAALFETVAVKPVHSRGSRDVFVIERGRQGLYQPDGHREAYLDLDTFRREHLDMLVTKAPLLVMEGLVAPAFDIDVLSHRGEALRIIPRRRTNPSGIPFRGGTVLADKAMAALGAQVTRALDLSWLYDFDLMSDREGNAKFVELNPRPSGSIAAAAFAGIPIYDDLVSLAKGETLTPLSIDKDVTVLPYTDLVEARA